MAKVYVVTSGCYSDYGIDGLFSTRENAIAALGAMGECLAAGDDSPLTDDGQGFYSQPTIEEWELDDALKVTWPCTYTPLFGAEIVLETGELLDEPTQFYGDQYPHGPREWPKSALLTQPKRILRTGKGKVKRGRKKYRTFWCLSAVSEEHARKVCIEKHQARLREKALCDTAVTVSVATSTSESSSSETE